MFRDLTWQQVPAGDVQLLFLRVTGQLDDFHAVDEGRMNRRQLVRGGDEQHLRQIDRHFEIVIAERVILRRVEHLQQCGGGIALVASGNLVNLVEHEHRIY